VVAIPSRFLKFGVGSFSVKSCYQGRSPQSLIDSPKGKKESWSPLSLPSGCIYIAYYYTQDMGGETPHDIFYVS
jgi:hypothetical protein